MTPIDQLLESVQSSPKRIAVVGEAIEDVWIEGSLTGCQDACPCFKEAGRLSTPGGAAGAVRQLAHWPAVERFLIAPLRWSFQDRHYKGWPSVPRDLAIGCSEMPVKNRWLIGDRIVFRSDEHDDPWSDVNVYEWRHLTMKAVETMKFDGVLISDYDKGFLDGETIGRIVAYCNKANIPVVADAKRPPCYYEGAVLKCNSDYQEYHAALDLFEGPIVATCGLKGPAVMNGRNLEHPSADWLPGVPCHNHVGAGDCFAAHLLLGLVHGLPLEDAAAIAHSAGRVYVQNRYGRPPWPHEIRKDLDPSGGKVVGGSPSSTTTLGALRESIPGRIVFTNGVFRLLTPAHVEFLRWAKAQADVLVVGINDDESVCNLRGNKGYVLPLERRMKMLCAIEGIDWIVPFGEPDPCGIIEALKPDLLTKGGDYGGQRIPGDDLVKEVRFGPYFSGHATDLIKEIVQAEG